MADTALDRFFEIEKAKYGKAAYYFKPDKTSSKIRAFYARPFCPKYTQTFSTTMYPNTFFAEKKKGNTQSCLETEYHENVHKWDRWHEGFAFVLKYAWPHWMCLPFLVATIALGGLRSWVAFAAFIVVLHIDLGLLALSAKFSNKGIPEFGSQLVFNILVGLALLALIAVNIWSAEWFALLWLGVFLFLSPWPFKPFWRRNYEIRGYTMSLYRIWLKHKDDFEESLYRDTVERYVKIFAGPSYLFMGTDKEYVRNEFLFQAARMQFSERRFLAHWVWWRDMKHRLAEEAEPFRMAKFSIDREGFGG